MCCDQLLAAGLRQYADGSVQMASVIRRETDFDPEAIAVLADAVDEAWYRLRRSGSECVRPAYARVMREVVARRIIEMAQGGTSDPKELAEEAVRFLATNYRMDAKQTRTKGLPGADMMRARRPAEDAQALPKAQEISLY